MLLQSTGKRFTTAYETLYAVSIDEAGPVSSNQIEKDRLRAFRLRMACHHFIVALI
ncbi:MAG: hypothetical protein AAGU11_13490 [Syntrophobacteraceae bacterium]